MPKLPLMRTKDFLKTLIAFGCEEVHVHGSHHKVLYLETGMASVVAVHGGEDLQRYMFAAILKQLGIDVDEFLNFIEHK